MVHRYLRRFRVVSKLIIRKQVSYQFLLQNFKKLRKMESVNTLKELGYVFNSAGELRKLNGKGELTDQPFQFKISDNHQECQDNYEKLGDAITPYIYHLLESQEKLVRLPVPKENENGTFIFASDGYDSKDTLLILIHGSGVVRAGQWARSLIINENLECGTQIPYIRNALAFDYGVLVMNTNDSCTSDGKEIPYSSTPEDHAKYVWDTYIAETKALSILIVAHSYGGVVTVTLANHLKEEFETRVKAIAFTDSVHGYSNIKISKYLKQITRNWISSAEPLDTPLKTPDFDVPRLSAGHTKHEMTSHSCMESVFKFFEKMLKK